jgi:hypothetical protein
VPSGARRALQVLALLVLTGAVVNTLLINVIMKPIHWFQIRSSRAGARLRNT